MVRPAGIPLPTALYANNNTKYFELDFKKLIVYDVIEGARDISTISEFLTTSLFCSIN